MFVPLLGWFEDSEKVFLAMEYYPLGDLAKYIDGTIMEDGAKQIASGILTALEIMHEEGFTHRDLKPQVKFLGRNYTLLSTNAR